MLACHVPRAPRQSAFWLHFDLGGVQEVIPIGRFGYSCLEGCHFAAKSHLSKHQQLSRGASTCVVFTPSLLARYGIALQQARCTLPRATRPDDGYSAGADGSSALCQATTGQALRPSPITRSQTLIETLASILLDLHHMICDTDKAKLQSQSQ